MARNSSSYKGEFWSQAANIKTVVFETELNPKENTAYSYDVSDKQNKSVMSYLVPDTEDTTKYILYIQSNEKICANPNSSYLFSNFTNLETIDGLENFDTSIVTDMSYMFQNCNKLTSLDVSDFDTSKVTYMRYMFYNCSNLTTLDVSNFNTSKVTNMGGMFSGCSILTLLDVSNFDTSKVTSMGSMFYSCRKLTTLDVSNFNTSKVTSMGTMFCYCSSITTLDVSNFDTSNVTSMKNMFSGCSILTLLDVSNFDTSNVTDMGGMFCRCNSLKELDVSNFNTNKVTDMSGMFYYCRSITTLDVSNFDTSNVTNMGGMFSICSSLTSLDLSNFDTSNVTIFSNSLYLGMFYNCSSITALDVSSFDTGKVTDMSYMFSYCINLTTLDVSNFNTSNVTDMSYMFAMVITNSHKGTKLTEIVGLINFNTSNVTTMNQMFSGCSVLTTLDLSNFDTSNVTNMHGMFNECSSLKSLDLSNFDTSNVTDFGSSDYYYYDRGMFQKCSNLTTSITIQGTKAASYYRMFENAATEDGSQITVVYIPETYELSKNMVATKSSNSNVIMSGPEMPEYSIDVSGNDTVISDFTIAHQFKTITLSTTQEGYAITSFKMNGQTIKGNSFKMPAENVTITDIVLSEATIIESEHNPYQNSLNDQEYLNKTWDGANSLTVILEYQTESTSYDWIYLYDKDNKAYGKYGGKTKKTETLTIPGDTLRIVFRTDAGVNNYYGFKATIIPNY